MIEREAFVTSAGARLAGTTCLPLGPGRFPTVLMIHGSGPLNRDENMPGQRLNVFNTIAHALAASGVASVRYDKRGCGKSSGDYYRTGHADLVGDTIAWVDALRDYDFCDPSRLYLLGHSEGCIIAPQVSLKRRAIAGLILLCPTIEKVRETLLRQAEQIERELEGARGLVGALQRFLMRLYGRPLANQQALLALLETSSDDVIRRGLQRVPAKWLRELVALDAPAIFARVECPMLLVGGAKDVQCQPADVRRIAETARCETEQHVLENLTHVLRIDEESPSLLGTAKLLRKPVDPRVLSLVSAWLSRA